MHKQILSDRERSIIQHFLESDEKLEGFRMLKKRVLDYNKRIFEDSELIKKFIDALAKVSP